MTTLYFESSDEDDLLKTGFSKDGKHQCPQIFIGLLVGLGGYAIGYDIYEGNTYEGHTLIPFLEKMRQKFNLDKPVVIADSGLLSKNNIEAHICISFTAFCICKELERVLYQEKSTISIKKPHN
jgi:transposase